jgi:hypothetical protein
MGSEFFILFLKLLRAFQKLAAHFQQSFNFIRHKYLYSLAFCLILKKRGARSKKISILSGATYI